MPRGFGRFWWWLMFGNPLWYGWGFRIYPPFYLPPWPWYFNPWFWMPASKSEYLSYLKEEERILNEQLKIIKEEIAEIEKQL